MPSRLALCRSATGFIRATGDDGHIDTAKHVGVFDVNIPVASVERMKERGAPIDWTALGDAPAVRVGIGIAAQAPHPKAAKVFLDFVLSRGGQKLMQSPGRLVARGDVANEQAALPKGLKIVPVNPDMAKKTGSIRQTVAIEPR